MSNLYCKLLNYCRRYAQNYEALLFFAFFIIIYLLTANKIDLNFYISLDFLLFALLFVTLLSLDDLFFYDKADGSLDLILMQNNLYLLNYIYQQIFCHFITRILPVILFYPIFAYLLQMPNKLILFSLICFSLTSLTILFIGSISASLKTDSKNSALSRLIINLPLNIPTIIFCLCSLENFIKKLSAPTPTSLIDSAYLAPLAFLLALCLLFIIIGPCAASLILRYINE